MLIFAVFIVHKTFTSTSLDLHHEIWRQTSLSALQLFVSADTLEAWAFNHPRQQSYPWEDWNSSIVHGDLVMTQKQFSWPCAGEGLLQFSSVCLWVQGSLSGKLTSVVMKGTIRALEGLRERGLPCCQTPIKNNSAQNPTNGKAIGQAKRCLPQFSV